MAAVTHSLNPAADGSTDQNDSGNQDGTAVVVTQGVANTNQNADPTQEVNPAASFDFGIKPGKALAVSLSYVHAERSGDGTVHFTWETATETGNAGFNLYMLVDGQQILVTTEMVPSSVIDSVTPVYYSYKANVPGDQYIIEMISISGESQRYGPFDLGREYGSANTAAGKMRNSLFLPVIVAQ